jgi:exodeoxyribonuclease VII large subunit
MDDLLEDASPGTNTPEFTVGELSGAIKKTIEGSFGRVRVRGEVGRVMQAKSGHMYYDLKDDRNVIACTTWKGQVSGLGMIPEEGLEVIVTGKLSTFGPQSKYNLNVDSIEVAGEGALMAMLEKRKKALAAEGLFAEDRKRPIPYLPEVIGVVTSPSGAVIRDILHRLRDRFPRKVLVWPVAVQGERCAPEVTRAIQGFNALTPGGAVPRPDLLIVARGGGSIEDLWGFNEEIVARAAAASEIPLISAVGHETDTTLIDYVSDHRAPTPTAAAEKAVPVRLDLLSWLDGQGGRLLNGMRQTVGTRRQRHRDLSRALPQPQNLLNPSRQRLDYAGERLPGALRAATQTKRSALTEAAAILRPATLRARALAPADQRLQMIGTRLPAALQSRTATKADRFQSLAARLTPALDRAVRDQRRETDQARTKLAETTRRLKTAWLQGQGQRVEKIANIDRLRETLGYEATLGRGYAVVWGDGALVTTAKAAKSASELEIQFQDGRHRVGAGAVTKSKPKKPPEDQGSLF